jgi:hypothetical protein
MNVFPDRIASRGVRKEEIGVLGTKEPNAELGNGFCYRN